MEGFSRDMLETASQASLSPTLDENGRMMRRKHSNLAVHGKAEEALKKLSLQL